MRGFEDGTDLLNISWATGVNDFSDLTLEQHDKGVLVDYGEGLFLIAGATLSQITESDFIW